MHWKPLLSTVAMTSLLLPVTGCNEAKTPEVINVDHEANRPMYDEDLADGPVDPPRTSSTATPNDPFRQSVTTSERMNPQETASTPEEAAAQEKADAEEKAAADQSEKSSAKSSDELSSDKDDIVEKPAEKIPEDVKNEESNKNE